MTAIFANLFGLLFAILASGVGIGIALAITAMMLAPSSVTFRSRVCVAQHTFNILTTSDLVALPLFVMMGEFLFRTNLSTHFV